MDGIFLYPSFLNEKTLSEKQMENLIDEMPAEPTLKNYIEQEKKDIRKTELWDYANKNFFNDDGSGWEMSPGEFEIFQAIVLKEHSYVEIITSTQYGKTLTISRAILTRITTFPDEFMVVSPDLKRGQILLNYIVKDTAANEYFSQKLTGMNIKERNLMMRLLEEKSKVKLTYTIVKEDDKVGYGSVEVLSVQAKRKKDAITAVMGFGGNNIVQDEAALEDDEVDAGVYRMMAGKGKNVFHVKIGNPFFRNHFRRDWVGQDYKKIYVDHKIAVIEGRYEPEFLEKAKVKPKFDVLFECRFPAAEAIDSKGWMNLLTEDEVRLAMQGGTHFGEERLGGDPADEGVNASALIKRSFGYAEILFSSSKSDLMDFAGQTVLILDDKERHKADRVYVDRVGVGAGYLSRLNEVKRAGEKKWSVMGVNAGEKAADERYFNKRAEMYWRLRAWLKAGGKLSRDERWMELAKVKYKPDSSGKLKIMSKDEMRENSIESPDHADALALTFYDPDSVKMISREEKFFMQRMRQNKLKQRQRMDPSDEKMTRN